MEARRPMLRKILVNIRELLGKILEAPYYTSVPYWRPWRDF